MENEDSSLLKPPLNLRLFVNQFNNATPEDNFIDPDSGVVLNKYYDIEEL